MARLLRSANGESALCATRRAAARLLRGSGPPSSGLRVLFTRGAPLPSPVIGEPRRPLVRPFLRFIIAVSSSSQAASAAEATAAVNPGAYLRNYAVLRERLEASLVKHPDARSSVTFPCPAAGDGRRPTLGGLGTSRDRRTTDVGRPAAARRHRRWQPV